jgi:hypothetical protein
MIEKEFPSTRGMIEEESEEEFPFPPPQPAKLRRDSANIIKAAFNRKVAQNDYDAKLEATKTLQAALRRKVAQKDYDDKLKATKTVEAALRRKFAQKDYDDKLKATKTIEAALRGKFAQKDYGAKLGAAHTIKRAVQHRNDKLMKERDIQAKRKRIFGELKKSIEHDDKEKATRKLQSAVRRKLAEQRQIVANDEDDDDQYLSADEEEEDPFLSADEEEEIVSDDESGYVSSDHVLRERKYDEYGIGKNAVRVYDL